MQTKQEGLAWFSFVADESAPQTRSVTLTRTVQEAVLVFSCWPNAVSLSIMNSVNQKDCQDSIWHWQIGQHCSVCLLRQYAFSKMKSCFLVRKIPQYCSTKTGNNSLNFSSISKSSKVSLTLYLGHLCSPVVKAEAGIILPVLEKGKLRHILLSWPTLCWCFLAHVEIYFLIQQSLCDLD